MDVYNTILKTFLPTFLTMFFSTVHLPFLPARSKRFNLKSIIITIIIKICIAVQSWNTTMNDNFLPLFPLPHRVFCLNPDQGSVQSDHQSDRQCGSLFHGKFMSSIEIGPYIAFLREHFCTILSWRKISRLSFSPTTINDAYIWRDKIVTSTNSS